MLIIARSILFATGLLFAAVTANAQAYYSGYYYPYYTAYPGYTYHDSYYYNYAYPWYSGSPRRDYEKPSTYCYKQNRRQHFRVYL